MENRSTELLASSRILWQLTHEFVALGNLDGGKHLIGAGGGGAGAVAPHPLEKPWFRLQIDGISVV